MIAHECDVCIVGGGISAALLAQTIRERVPGTSVIVVEAGRRIFDVEQRPRYRQRNLDYGENPWPEDFIDDQAAEGIISRTMAVGGSALHWGGVTNRFSEEDLRLRSMYGLAVDWPIEWTDLERYYCEVERRIGVAGEPGVFEADRRSEPYPMPPMELSHNLVQLRRWAEKSGIPFWSTPVAKNTMEYDGRGECRRCATCAICPTGARYSPDFTFKRLLAGPGFALHDRTLVRKLATGATGERIEVAHAVQYDRPDEPIEYRARYYVVASGYAWSSHLLLLSAGPRHPEGLANSSGLVGRYLNGHSFAVAHLEMDAQLFPGMNEPHSLISRQFFRCPPDRPFVRHDLRVWESDAGREPRLTDDAGRLLLGDALMRDWRARARRGAARVRMYYDVHPDRESRLTLDRARANRFGDPLPRIEHRLDGATRDREAATRAHLTELFARLASADNGKVLSTSFSTYLDHPAGGCRMGTDPAESVCDSHGRTHDHENLFVVGAPTLPTGGCTNGTLTFAALTLRSADRLAEDLGASAA